MSDLSSIPVDYTLATDILVNTVDLCRKTCISYGKQCTAYEFNTIGQKCKLFNIPQNDIRGSNYAPSGKCYFNPEADDIWGRIFVTSLGFGKDSYHFISKDQAGGGSYISQENYTAGTNIVAKKYLEKIKWDRDSLTMTAEVNYQADTANAGEVWFLNMKFKSDYSSIESGTYTVVNTLGTTTTTLNFGALTMIYTLYA